MSKKVISATITPLKADGSLDKAGLKNVLERNIRHGLDGVFLFGSLQLFFIGLLGEYILSINSRVMHRPLVIEEERLNFE